MRFRQWGSMTPGHPEHGIAPGIETTTGPLGQGVGNSVGMAIAEASLAARFNRPGYDIVNHHTFVLAGDGDMMEGVSAESASLAGHLKLGKLILLYDDNHISIEGSTDLAFTEDRAARFAAYGWQTLKVADGNDVHAITEALKAAIAETERPSFVEIRTHIGYGSPDKQDTASAHGEPLGVEEVKLTKENLGWPVKPDFYIPDEALAHFREAVDRGKKLQEEWQALFDAYIKEYPDLAAEFSRVIEDKLPHGWDNSIPLFKPEDGPMATRAASGKVMNAVAPQVPELIGGSADLAPSTKTLLNDSSDFSAVDRSGRNLHFGVREHGMGAILNGMTLHGGMLPYGATFLIFSDYMRPPIRLAAMNHLHVIYVYTHDSIGLGEDGPTHQPVEQLLGLRSVPGLVVIRPADANESAQAWKVAIARKKSPIAMVFTRQKLPVLDVHKHANLVEGVTKGGYILADSQQTGNPIVVLVATGSEVHLALAAREKLATEKIDARIVSMPSWELFMEQPESYRNEILPADVPTLAIEAGVSLGWKPYFGKSIEVIGVDRFGASAPGKVVMDKLGFNVDNVVAHVHKILKESSK